MEQILEPTGEKMVYFEKFLSSFIRNDSRLVFLRTPVTKLSQIESSSASYVIYAPSKRMLQIQTKQETQPIQIPVDNFDKIEWLELSAGKRIVKVIQITLKDDKIPIILGAGHSSQEVLDFWYDGLRLLLRLQPSTESSAKKIAVFERAVNYAQIAFNVEEPVIPPPPSSLDYPTPPKMPVILAKKQQ